ncbi:hypothetical protein F5877DRAFT_85924 [Lentinula edodes]|nr:hypothetical protein F5877DRAFT_85924 [Lentinula edodes]
MVSIQPKPTGPDAEEGSAATGDCDKEDSEDDKDAMHPEAKHLDSQVLSLHRPARKFGCNSATASDPSRESESNSPDLFDAPPYDYVQQKQSTYSTAAASVFLAYYTPANADGRQIPGDSAVEAADDVVSPHIDCWHPSTHRVHTPLAELIPTSSGE